jgi:hypothetical protein
MMLPILSALLAFIAALFRSRAAAGLWVVSQILLRRS